LKASTSDDLLVMQAVAAQTADYPDSRLSVPTSERQCRWSNAALRRPKLANVKAFAHRAQTGDIVALSAISTTAIERHCRSEVGIRVTHMPEVD
jgi:hypothetical protein